MSKEQDFYNALHDLRRAYPTGITTMGKCCIKGCDIQARGGGLCPTHAEHKLAEVIGDKEIAIKLHEAISNQRDFTFRALDHMGV